MDAVVSLSPSAMIQPTTSVLLLLLVQSQLIQLAYAAPMPEGILHRRFVGSLHRRNIFEDAVDFGEDLVDKGKDAVNDAVDVADDVIEKAIEKVKGWVDTAKDAITGTVGGFIESAKKKVEGLWNEAKSKFDEIKQKVMKIKDMAADGIKGLLKKMLSKFIIMPAVFLLLIILGICILVKCAKAVAKKVLRKLFDLICCGPWDWCKRTKKHAYQRIDEELAPPHIMVPYLDDGRWGRPGWVDIPLKVFVPPEQVEQRVASPDVTKGGTHEGYIPDFRPSAGDPTGFFARYPHHPDENGEINLDRPDPMGSEHWSQEERDEYYTHQRKHLDFLEEARQVQRFWGDKSQAPPIPANNTGHGSAYDYYGNQTHTGDLSDPATGFEPATGYDSGPPYYGSPDPAAPPPYSKKDTARAEKSDHESNHQSTHESKHQADYESKHEPDYEHEEAFGSNYGQNGQEKRDRYC
ncbi:hypothetical protein BJ508DRAFT_54517 [Ascobolus immersus RN42]|uniref:Uncharacterized protein n=1 Tax=Ascobolus immersus RN42 TaxID=1160509 RepID=A0A3N4HJS3_ASCIM|nr:hypothetical protein BJ508DRAFT_54517 [Ascobolus immersus RN42]